MSRHDRTPVENVILGAAFVVLTSAALSPVALLALMLIGIWKGFAS